MIESEYATVRSEQTKHDASDGNVLAALTAADSERISSTDFLVFPMGETGQRLSMDESRF